MSAEAPGNDWVTVAEAARRLGIGERRAYRLAASLSDSDRQTSDSRRTLVRQTALALAAGIAHVEADPPRSVSDSVRQASDKGAENVGQSSDRALVEQLRSENTYLRAALEREQENTRAALAQLADSDTRLAAVLAATGRLQLPDHHGVQTPAQDAPEGPTRGDGDPDGDSADPAGNDRETDTANARAPWWARLWGRG